MGDLRRLLHTQRHVLRTGRAPERLVTTLSSGFGTLATLLAAIGLYGVMAYIVAQRTREIGVRIALGASSGDVIRLVMKDGVGPYGNRHGHRTAGRLGFEPDAAVATLWNPADRHNHDSGSHPWNRIRGADGRVHPGKTGCARRPDERPAVRVRNGSVIVLPALALVRACSSVTAFYSRLAGLFSSGVLSVESPVFLAISRGPQAASTLE